MILSWLVSPLYNIFAVFFSLSRSEIISKFIADLTPINMYHEFSFYLQFQIKNLKTFKRHITKYTSQNYDS